jgi:hypothetical protein
VCASIILTPTSVRAATTVGVLLIVQVMASIAINQLGLLGVPVQSASLPRVGGAFLIVVGVAMVQRFYRREERVRLLWLPLVQRRPLLRTDGPGSRQDVGPSGIQVVYGGGHVGLMGAVANATLAAAGDVTGVMPKAFVDCEIAYMGLTRLRVVGWLDARAQAIMTELSEGFVTLPGGTGTLEGFFEILR